MPIGIFDSGTGGLTVLDAIVNFDQYNNSDHSFTENGDGIKDFQSEYFIYLGDQANMPYGNYSLEYNLPLLLEHIIKDVQFLLGNKYYLNAESQEYETDKAAVKVIVIACNTATAYGKTEIERFLSRAQLDLKVIGVIDAGVRAALAILNETENSSIAVMATVGTVESNGYKDALLEQKKTLGYSGNVDIFQQAGLGVAGAIDGSPEFISIQATKPRKEYRGPSESNNNARIDTSILNRYGFEWKNNQMLFDGDSLEPKNIQINSISNYISYHLVSLLEQIRKANTDNPLKVIILGCTHYPFYLDVFQDKLQFLYNYQENGRYIYRPSMAQQINLVDPAQNTAKELYGYLQKTALFNSADLDQSEFYISIPNLKNREVVLDSAGNFSYQYKYDRQAGCIQQYVRCVPFSRKSLPPESINRIKTTLPLTYELIYKFNRFNYKTQSLSEAEKF